MRAAAMGLITVAVVSAVGEAQVVNPRITTDSTIDCSSAQAVVKQIIKPGMSDEEKAVACWRFMLDHFYHWYPPREPDSGGDVRDFAKMVNSYGFGPCFVAAPVQTALWEAAGFKTRSWTITGHSIPEVFYGGAWHMLDSDARGWHRKADGQIASVEELSKDGTLFTAPKEKSDPYYAFAAPDVVAKPLDPWGPPSQMMDLYLSRKDNYRYNKRAVMGHPMYLTLRPGERLTLSDTNDSKFFNAGFPEEKLKTGPVDVTGKHTYGNGRLVWEPHLSALPLDQLLWSGSSNVKREGQTLMAADTSKPAVAVFRVWSPYVLVGARVAFSFALPERPEATTRGKLPAAWPGFEISVDDGQSWQKLSLVMASGTMTDQTIDGDIGQAVAGRYAYLVRMTFNDAKPYRLAFHNTLQLAPLSLPRLKVGKNKVTVFRGPDEGVVSLTQAEGKHAKERYVVEAVNLNVPKAIEPVKFGEPAHVVYKLTAPAALTALSIGGNLTMDRGKDQYIAASYSLDAGKTWTEVWRIADNDNPDNSQFEEDGYVPLRDCKSREALVKFAMVRNSKYFGVATIRLYGFYRQVQPKEAKLAVTLAWQEQVAGTWVNKERSVTVDAFPYAFDLDCGGEAVRLRRIEMTP